MKKWTGRWLECRIRSFWSVHSKGPSWQLTQRPLQKNRSLTLTTVRRECVWARTLPKSPRCCLQLLKRNEREKSRAKERSKERGIERKRDIGACFLSSVGQERDGWRWQGIYLLPKRPLKRGAAVQNTIPKQSHMMTGTINFSFHLNGFPSPTQPQGFLKVLKFWSRTACMHWFREFTVRANLIRKNTAERFSLPRNYFFNAFEVCHIRAPFMTVIRCVLWTLEDRTSVKSKTSNILWHGGCVNFNNLIQFQATRSNQLHLSICM